ncbi:MAG TPA: CHASE4 domain-containing protein [Candidatus Acidoferrales bacterium]|nr:CHASE4 domain-containing protein [Candidatus Acidoferrales bacterium]
MGSKGTGLFHLPSSLRQKTLLIIGLTMFAAVGSLFLLSRILLLRGYARLEEDFASQNLERAASALTNELNTLDRITSEYASWDQTYAYLHGENPAYVKSEFPASTFQQLKIGFVVILDNSGHKVFSKGFDLVRAGEAPLPTGLDVNLKAGSSILDHKSLDSAVMGILILKDGPVLMVSRPVLTSDSHGPIAGTLIMGRALDSAEVLNLSEMIHVPLSIERLDDKTANSDSPSADRTISARFPVHIRAIDQDSLDAHEVLNDIYGHPAIILRVTLQRTIYEQAQTTLLQFSLLLVAAGLIFGAGTLYLLERVILSRVANLSDGITHIGASGNLSARLEVRGKDELAYLGTAINSMLEDLENAQAEQHQGRTRLGVMMEKMPAILWTTDTELRYTSAIGAGLEPLGLRSNELAGKTLFEYFQTRDPEFPSIAAHKKALNGKSVTYELQWKNRVLESHVQPLKGNEGELIGVIGVGLDITDRKHLADQLRQAQKMQAVGELAGGVAHDFNNLLMVVKGHAEMLIERLPQTSPQRFNVEQIQTAAERAASLTRQLLAFSRKQVLKPRVLDLNEVVGGMIQMVSRVIDENIELAFLPGPKLGNVKADPSQIEQVVLNLVVNARDAMPSGGRLTIETSSVELDKNYTAKHAVVEFEPGPYVMLTVTDTGCGMDAQTQARIFEPFFTTKEPGKGTGLGLATVYGVVKQSGGYVWVYSELGQGTTFKVYLPMVAATAERLAAEKISPAPSSGTETILFVEDEQSVRELVREYLSGCGYSVLEAADGVQALEIAAMHPGVIQLLVTDVVMPRLSGRELAAQIASSRRDLKVLYISGYTDDSVFRHGVLEGGMEFLQKPFNLKALAQKIREILDGRSPTPVLRGRSSNGRDLA